MKASPPDALVMIDGHSYGSASQSPFTIPLQDDNLTPTVEVEIVKDRFAPRTAPVKLRAGEVSTLEVTLEAKARP